MVEIIKCKTYSQIYSYVKQPKETKGTKAQKWSWVVSDELVLILKVTQEAILSGLKSWDAFKNKEIGLHINWSHKPLNFNFVHVECCLPVFAFFSHWCWNIIPL